MHCVRKHTLIKLLSVGIFLLIFSTSGNAQGIKDTLLHEAVIYNGDTIESKTLDNIWLYTKMTDAQRAAYAKYNRLRNAVYVTYPFARRAGGIMNDINARLVTITSKSDRKSYIKSREKELKKEFSDPLTNLSVYQGKVLMKLINRETGNNCYEIIKEYKGGFNARFYQTVAFFFNSNLKQPYNASTDDAVIEKFVREVQRMYGYSDLPRNPAM
ncbi:MAG TPA: DUF4294 domain-containing protein [Ferruginibacter sp.]|nr:DUF4294 domain-containing protein [Ferruginibacter sp.]